MKLATLPLAPIADEAQATRSCVPRYWKPASLAEHLGFSRQAIYKAIQAGHLPAVRIFGSLRICEDAVLAYIAKAGR